MWMDGLWIMVSFVLLFAGAEYLVKGGASMALKLGMSPLVVGLTVVAYGTSMPEFVVSLKSAFAGQPDIAVGNVVGSNIVNIAVVLALSAVVYPVATHTQVLRRDLPVLVGVTLLAPLTFLDGKVSHLEGGLLLIGAFAYTWWAVRRSKVEPVEVPEVPEVGKSRSVIRDVLLIAVGMGLLVGGSRLLVDHAVVIAKAMGVSEAVIGLTIVAAGTSMPELATSLVAAFRKHSDIALGNVIGSNLFNLLFVLGGSAAIHPLATGGMTPIDLITMIGVTLLLVPMLVSGRRLSRGEGLLLVACYAGYLVAMWPTT